MNQNDQDELEALRAANAKLSRLLAISEYQKENLKKKIVELQEKITELIRN